MLVVEDDSAIARVLELELGEAGYHVEVAPAGSDGLAAMERAPTWSCSMCGYRTWTASACAGGRAAPATTCRS